ncbi:Der GTPase-activating protein YihI [Vibrio sp. CAU 1672]|uniref:Der GTPase-activating protein YihI n=1 Tax=Vibrio sp. CAU 1672 TaxID=3032594 RepID=UPI0023D9C316|nr:Der GTPase-activating protein YihI [Vibrio sp. CAU 1672]MDF2154014.1 Der GTPase-activating protein YihI [Vibrio sp. CAU 1672]
MSRTKKSRKPGAAGAPEFVVTRNRTESDVEGRLRKRAKKRKGLKTGNRNSEANEQKKQAAAQQRDPRLGSKKKIPLIVEPVKKMTKQERRLTAEQELEMLENDAQLNVLLDRIEAGENLGKGLQQYVDEKLDRIEQLMDQLGLLEPEQEQDQDFTPAKGSRNEDDLLADFEDLNLDDYKG